MLRALAIENYRSIRKLVMPLSALNLITGPNGSGKSNLYRALRLLAETANGGVGALLAQEGGLRSALWAGPERISRQMRAEVHPVQGTVRTEAVRLKLGFLLEDFGYAIQFGLPTPSRSAFALDPEIKSEAIWVGERFRPAAVLMQRRGATVELRNDPPNATGVELDLYESIFTQLLDPERAPEILMLRERIRGWRFYDQIRTDYEAPARMSPIGTRTPVLHHDARDLAAAIRTIQEVGDSDLMDETLDSAFPGSRLEVRLSDDGRFSLYLHQKGLLRALSMLEVSDGTLRFLVLLAALLTPRPPEMMILNEPETSLHPELLPAVAALVRRVSRKTQLWVISHSAQLVELLAEDPGCRRLTLTKEFGQTECKCDDERLLSWSWPS